MKVVLASLMLLLVFIAIDCRPFEETEKREDTEEIGDKIYQKYLDWKKKQPHDSDTSFKAFLESTGTNPEERELSDTNLDLEERGIGKVIGKGLLQGIAIEIGEEIAKLIGNILGNKGNNGCGQGQECY